MKKKRKTGESDLGKAQNSRPIIGYFAPSMGGFGQLVWSGIVDMARKEDVNLICFEGAILRDPTFWAQSNIIYDLVTTENVDGVISWASIMGDFSTIGELEAFHERYRSLPVVTMGRMLERFPGVLMDSYNGMREAVSHLIEVHGYRRLAFIRGPEDHVYAQGRYRAYIETLEAYDIPFDPKLVTPPASWIPPEGHTTGMEAIRLLLDERGLRPQTDLEAVVGASEFILLGAIENLQTRGVNIPGEVAVVGFDDTILGQTNIPPLTSVASPFYKTGYQTAEILLALMEGDQVPHETIVPSKLVVRQSCGCLLPAVAQVATNLVEVRNETLETALADRQVDILSEMRQQVEDSAGHLAGDWTKRLLQSFVAELQGNSPHIFLRELDKILRQGITGSGDVFAWQDAVSVLRRKILPYLKGDELLQAIDLWEQARVIIGEAAQRQQAYQSLQAGQQVQTLREIGAALIIMFEVGGLMDILAENLPALGIPSCYLSLYENPQPYEYPHQTAPEWSRLVLAYTEKDRVELEPDGQRFRSHDLLPEGMWPEGRQVSFVAEPLYFQENQLGFALFEMGPTDGAIYGTLRGQISSALQGALILRERQQAETALEQAYAKVEQQVEERTQELQQEIVERKRAETELQRYQEHLEELVSERTRALEEAQVELMQQERLSALGQLTATVAHEIRNPLGTVRNSVFSISTAIERGQLNRVEPALQRAERNITRCDNIITELLDYTRTHELKLQPLCFDEWLQRVLAEQTIPEGITLSVDLVKDVEVLLDPERFRRAIVNLVDNACQAMQETSPPDRPKQILHIHSEIVDKQLKISISDTGPGIPPELMAHIFEPLYSTKSFGVGLGLPVVQEIINQHGGKIEINSEAGVGTQVVVWLPLV